MFKFLLKGIIRDRSRYLFPVLIVSAGVALLVFTLSFMRGYEASMIRQNSRFDTGHFKVVTNAYNEIRDQRPYDLGFLDIEEDLQQWKTAFPELDWVERINFGALMDLADSEGNSLEQGQVIGFGIDLLHSTREHKNFRLDHVVQKGSIPSAPGEILIADLAFTKMNLSLSDSLTLIGSTVHGSMAFARVKVVGTISFGFEALDLGGIIADISDVRDFLDMQGGSGELLAFFRDDRYNDSRARAIRTSFNRQFSSSDEFAPIMLALSDQGNLGYMIGLMRSTFFYIGLVFTLILGLVLWNSGLMSGIKRYGEFGIRLAIGEEKRKIYGSLILEAIAIGIGGSVIGLLLGLAISYPLSVWGMDVSAYNRTSSIISEGTVYTEINFKGLVNAFIPGVLSTILGTALAGIAVFRRQTSQLFKELEQ